MAKPPVELLKKVTLFEELDGSALERLSRRLQGRTYAKDALIVSQDDPGDALYVIESGRVKVVLYGNGNGKEVILSIFREGDYFGEMSLLDNQPRSASVIALEDTQAWVLHRPDFVEYLQENPNASLNVLAEMCQRLRRADDIIGNLALLDVYGRLAHTLIDLAKSEGRKMEMGLLIQKRPTQQELASMIGTSRETVSRVLSEFQRRGFLNMQGKELMLNWGFVEQGNDIRGES